MENDVYKNSVRFIEINDFKRIFCERDGRICQYIFYRRNHVAYRLYLHSFYSQYIWILIHLKKTVIRIT